VGWDYSNIEDWRRDMHEIETLDLKLKPNLHRFGLFYAKTLDKIATPIQNNNPHLCGHYVNEELFEI